MQRRKNFIVKDKNQGFSCSNCGKDVSAHPSSVRNHCPYCLWSLHVDSEVPGDRAEPCQGLMRPIGAEKAREGYKITFQCQECGHEHRNKTAPDDDLEALLDIFK